MAYEDEDDTKPSKSDNDEDFLRKAKTRFKQSYDFWKPKYDSFHEDKRFYAGNSENGNQWPSNVVNMLDPRRPRLTINRLPQFHNQIVNDYRQSSIGLRAAPMLDQDTEIAKVYEGGFRQIEKQSNAQVAYLTALSNAAIGGIGWLRVVTDYVSHDSFDQDILIKRVINPARCFPDPKAEGFFFEDGRFFFYIDQIPYEQYEDEYGEDPTDFTADDFDGYWRNEVEETVTVAEYFYFSPKKRTLHLYDDGASGWEDERAEDDDRKIVRKSKRNVQELNYCKIDGYKKLEESVWPKPRIPFSPIWGNELWLEDERTFEGQVRGVKDSQRMYNYMQSTKTEMIALAPKAPYIAAEGQLEGREEEWRDAAVTPKSVLYYKPKTVDGVIVPPPQRQSYEAPVQAIVQASMQASEDMKDFIGVYDASLGARGNEVSGRAINARKQEGDTATYNYVDNLSLGMGYLGTIIAELFPVIYDTKRRLRMVDKEGKPSVVSINNPAKEDSVNIADSQYDLVLDTGPSYSTQRQEAVAIINDLAHNFPQLMQVAGDIAIRNMNFKGADEIADRLKRTLPPNVVGDDEDPQTKLAAAQNQLKMMAQQLQEISQQAQELKQLNDQYALELKNKAGELKIKQQEVDIKKMALVKDAGEGNDTAQSGTEYMTAIAELGNKIDELAHMVEAAVEEPQQSPSANIAPNPDDPSPDNVSNTATEGTDQ